MTANPSLTARRQSRFSGCMRCSTGFWQFRFDISLAGRVGANIEHQRSLLHPVDTASNIAELTIGCALGGDAAPDRPAPPVPLCSACDLRRFGYSNPLAEAVRGDRLPQPVGPAAAE